MYICFHHTWGFQHPNTCKHVRLFCVCFKMGHCSLWVCKWPWICFASIPIFLLWLFPFSWVKENGFKILSEKMMLDKSTLNHLWVLDWAQILAKLDMHRIQKMSFLQSLENKWAVAIMLSHSCVTNTSVLTPWPLSSAGTETLAEEVAVSPSLHQIHLYVCLLVRIMLRDTKNMFQKDIRRAGGYSGSLPNPSDVCVLVRSPLGDKTLGSRSNIVSTKNQPDVCIVQFSFFIVKFGLFDVNPSIWKPLSISFQTVFVFVHTSLLAQLVSPSFSTILSERLVMVIVLSFFFRSKRKLERPAVTIGCPSHLLNTISEQGTSCILHPTLQ